MNRVESLLKSNEVGKVVEGKETGKKRCLENFQDKKVKERREKIFGYR